ncbi:Penicillin-binding protein 1A [Escherichia coli]|uniref:Penicillin-binding protein 1A n=1 Tax=Escherichia coli TaxID=562 RepID=A0A377C5V1_ECOLX|nr:Penicillin-binding protein 1A [Escherichia coli]
MKFVKYFLILAVCCILLGAGSIYGLYRYIEPQLPDVATLKDVRLQIPMQIYSADGELIAHTVRNVVFRLRWIKSHRRW